MPYINDFSSDSTDFTLTGKVGVGNETWDAQTSLAGTLGVSISGSGNAFGFRPSDE